MQKHSARGMIWVLSLCALLPTIWVVTHLAAIPAPRPFAPLDSLLPLFSDRMLGALPGLFPVAIWAYAVAVALASALALILSARSGQIHAALLLSAALGAAAFFASQFIFVHRIPQLTTTPLLIFGDYLAVAALALSGWAAMQAAFCYPQPIEVEAYLAFLQKSRGVAREGSRWQRLHHWLYARSRLEKIDTLINFPSSSFLRRRLAAARSPWVPWILASLGCGAVALSQLAPASGWSLGLITLVVVYPSIGMAGQAFSVLNWQYRTGRDEDKARISWLVLGLVLSGWLVLIPQLGALVWSAFGDAERAGTVMLFSVCLELPMMAIVMVLLLGCSIFFFGAIDPNLAIRKTSVYGIAALLLAVTVAIFQGSAATQLALRLGLPGNSGLVLAGAIVGLVFAPLRGRIEGGVTRIVDRVLPASTLAEARRETVTVVFGDMSGYTELSARDETTALTLASLLHKESRRLAERHGGRLVKTIGDAVLLALADATEAVLACQELREKFTAAAGALQLPALPLHFGVHHGEVVRDQDGDIFGGTVNLAARLQGQAAAGEIIASGTVTTGLNAEDFQIEPLGERKLKNVPGLVACYRIA